MEHQAPAEAHALLAGDLTDTRLAGVLAALRADPAWYVPEPLEQGSERVFQAVYRPTGRPYRFPATRVSADRWRFRERPGWLRLRG